MDTVYDARHALTNRIEDFNPDVAILRQRICDVGRRIERIGIIGSEHELGWGLGLDLDGPGLQQPGRRQDVEVQIGDFTDRRLFVQGEREGRYLGLAGFEYAKASRGCLECEPNRDRAELKRDVFQWMARGVKDFELDTVGFRGIGNGVRAMVRNFGHGLGKYCHQDRQNEIRG
ncbi:MAG: hypothetical protein WBW88_10250 [Rhodothermales bacterium]